MNYKLSTGETIDVPMDAMEKANAILCSRKSKKKCKKDKKLSPFVKEILQYNIKGRLGDCTTKDLLVLNLTYNYHIINKNHTQARKTEQITTEISKAYCSPLCLT